MTKIETKVFSCPACGEKFEDAAVTEISAWWALGTDFRELHDGDDPLPFYAHLCPHCLYVATDLTYVPTLATKKYLQSPRYTAGLDPRDGRASTRYLLLARLQRASLFPAHQVAYNYLRASWLARGEGDQPRVVECQRTAIDLYQKALHAGMVPGPGRGAVHYVIGELYRLLSEFEESEKWFDNAINIQWRRELVERQRELARQHNAEESCMP